MIFAKYAQVFRYDGLLEYARRLNLDIFARAALPGDYSIIGGNKRSRHPEISKEEVIDFERKFTEVKNLRTGSVIGYYFALWIYQKVEDCCC